MELTIYETFEDFKENYLKDLPAYPGDLLAYLKEYLVLYNDIFAESDKLSEYFHPRDEEDKPLPEYPEIVYPVNLKMFELELQQRDNYLKNSYSEEINETLYQFLLLYERVYAFLEKEIQRVEIELKFIKQWGPGGFQQTALQVDPEPDNRELWEKIYVRFVDECRNHKHRLAYFSYLYHRLKDDKLISADDWPQGRFKRKLASDGVLNNKEEEFDKLKERKSVINSSAQNVYNAILANVR